MTRPEKKPLDIFTSFQYVSSCVISLPFIPRRNLMAVTTRVLDGDRLVVAKTGPADKLVAEAKLLRHCVGPHVVSVIDIVVDGDQAEMLLESAGDCTLSEYRPDNFAALAAIMASVVQAVADLHQQRVGHGSLTDEHVILGTNRHPVLCGFGHAASHPSSPTELDVQALGRMLYHHLLRLAGSQTSTWVERMTSSDRRIERQLRELATQAKDDPTTISATALATSLADLSPSRPALRGAQAVSAVEPSQPTSRDGSTPAAPSTSDEQLSADEPRIWRIPPRPLVPVSTRRRPVVVGAVVAVLVAITAGVVLVRGATAPPTEIASSTQLATQNVATATPTRTPIQPRQTTATTPSTTIRSEHELLAPCPTVVAAFTADHDRDGCLSPINISRGSVIVGDLTFRVGVPEDTILVGDWNCDGRSTLAVLRQSTGEIFVFDDWAVDGQVEATLVGQVTGPAAFTAVELPNGCQDLRVTHDTGQWTLTKTQT